MQSKPTDDNNLITDFIQGRAGLQPQPLGKGAIVYVVIQNRFTNIDAGQTANNVELMVGNGTGQVYNMLPGQESPTIYAKDLEDIFVRIRVAVGGVSAIDFPVLVYKERK